MIDSIVATLSTYASQPVVFNSESFWLLRLFFLPFFAIFRRKRLSMVLFLTAFSIFFYYCSAGWMTLLLLFRAIADYYLSWWMSKANNKTAKKTILSISIISSLGTLIYFKYAGFLTSCFSDIIGSNFCVTSVVIPLGISYYTFRSISYSIEVYRGLTTVPRNLLDYTFYLTYFPIILAGPIVRAGDFFQQLDKPLENNASMVFSSFFLVMKGLLKKALIADYLAQFNMMVFDNPDAYTGFEQLMALLGFGIQIYFDFSGYSDIAIGISKIIGIHPGINFKHPYKSTNISDFWRRWHISLSSWLRDFVYIPLGGSRCGKWRTDVNLLITMIVGGVWHGAGLTFLIWGALHGIALVVQKRLGRLLPDFKYDKFVYGIITFSFVTLLWALFCASSLNAALTIVCGIFNNFDFSYISFFFKERSLWIIVVILSYMFVFVPQRWSDMRQNQFVKLSWGWKLVVFCLLIQLILQFSDESVTPFLYANF